jgi:hypothetical protein
MRGRKAARRHARFIARQISRKTMAHGGADQISEKAGLRNDAQRADQPDAEIVEKAASASAQNLVGKPAADQADNDPGDDAPA